jgi:septum formation protein
VLDCNPKPQIPLTAGLSVQEFRQSLNEEAIGRDCHSPLPKLLWWISRSAMDRTVTERTMISPVPRLILASASPRRKELLAQLGVPFEVIHAEVTEHEAADTDPREMVRHNAELKADWVAARHPDAIVIGADTIVFIDRTVLNKPSDPVEARAMLRLLSGRTHTVFTGLAVRRRRDALKLDQGVFSEVTFKPLDDATIDLYLSRVHTLDKAGGYAIQEHGELIVAGFTGSLTNIVGLPLDELKQLLTKAGLTR